MIFRDLLKSVGTMHKECALVEGAFCDDSLQISLNQKKLQISN